MNETTDTTNNPIGTHPLPSVENLNQFYNFYEQFKQLTASIEGNNIVLHSHPKCSVSFNVLVIIEILREKINSLPNTDNEKYMTPPEIIRGIDDEIDNKLAWVISEFKRIHGFTEQNVLDICVKYHHFMSVLLRARIEYCKWEGTVRQHQVHATIKKANDEKDRIIKELKDRHENEKKEIHQSYLKQITRFRDEIATSKSIINKLQLAQTNHDMDLENLKGQIESLDSKIKSLEAERTESQTVVADLKVELKRAKDRLKTYQTNDEWMEAFTSTRELPQYINPSTGDIIKFPCAIDEFNKHYSITSTDEEGSTYTCPANPSKTIYIPAGLQIYLANKLDEERQAVVEEQQKEVKTQQKSSGDLKPNEERVFKVLRETGKWLNIRDLAEKTGIDKNHISPITKSLISKGLIEEEKRNARKHFHIKTAEKP